MKQVLVAFDDATAQRLEAVVPARSRRRADFIRNAVRVALDAIVEREMEESYRQMPEARGDHFFDPDAWKPFSPETHKAPIAETAGKTPSRGRRKPVRGRAGK